MGRPTRTCVTAKSDQMQEALSEPSTPKADKTIKKPSAKASRTSRGKKIKPVPASNAKMVATAASAGSTDAAPAAKPRQKSPARANQKKSSDANGPHAQASLEKAVPATVKNTKKRSANAASVAVQKKPKVGPPTSTSDEATDTAPVAKPTRKRAAKESSGPCGDLNKKLFTNEGPQLPADLEQYLPRPTDQPPENGQNSIVDDIPHLWKRISDGGFRLFVLLITDKAVRECLRELQIWDGYEDDKPPPPNTIFKMLWDVWGRLGTVEQGDFSKQYDKLQRDNDPMIVGISQKPEHVMLDVDQQAHREQELFALLSGTDPQEPPADWLYVPGTATPPPAPSAEEANAVEGDTATEQSTDSELAPDMAGSVAERTDSEQSNASSQDDESTWEASMPPGDGVVAFVGPVPRSPRDNTAAQQIATTTTTNGSSLDRPAEEAQVVTVAERIDSEQSNASPQDDESTHIAITPSDDNVSSAAAVGPLPRSRWDNTSVQQITTITNGSSLERPAEKAQLVAVAEQPDSEQNNASSQDGPMPSGDRLCGCFHWTSSTFSLGQHVDPADHYHERLVD